MKPNRPDRSDDGASGGNAEPLAIIGLGCRFPGDANDAPAFWRLLLDGTDALTDVPADRWEHSLFYHPEPGMPGKTVARQAGFVANVADFDCGFFGLSPREAAQMDPQHRLALEVSWEAIEDAGLDLRRIAGSPTAVFVGVSSREYSQIQEIETVGTYSSTGQASCMAANRISYAFDFTGPSVAVDTACSSALVAVHMACRSIWSGEATMALAAGVNLLIEPSTFVSFSALSMLSSDSRCRAFDARANGFARGEGAGAIVIKPLSQAQADGDRIDAVILASGVNQDGHSQGLTFPCQAAQEKLLREVYARAGVAGADVAYVEAHGTGTQAGDPVEAGALGEVLGCGRPAGRELIIGSVKTNIGHLESAAGIASVIKAALVLKHRHVPRNLHFEQPSPRISFPELGLRVPVVDEALDRSSRLLAGVNGFGFGGTNAHVLLGEAPAAPVTEAAASAEPAHYLLPISARSGEALKALAAAWYDLLDRPDAPALSDLCFSASVRRSHHSHRLAVSGRNAAELRDRLAAFLAGREAAGLAVGQAHSARPPRLAFVFTGQGPQWWAMGRELLATEPVFAEVVNRCDEIIRKWGGWSLIEELGRDEKSSRMQQTSIAQPAIFALQAGLTALWRAHGIEPCAITGHSVGEVAAAFAAGVMDLETAVRVALHRGGTMERASSLGAVLAVGLSEKNVAPYLAERTARVCVAALNSPSSLSLSGDRATLGEIARELERDGIFARFLRTDYAFHSPQMDPVEGDLRDALRDLEPRAAAVPLVSTVSGDWSPGTEWDAGYWWHNLRHPVRFAAAINRLIDHGCDAFLEIGPHPALLGSIKECLRERRSSAAIFASLRRGEAERPFFLETLAGLYVQGAVVRWESVHPQGKMAPLPRYPWQRERHWIGAERPLRDHTIRPTHPLLGIAASAPRPVWGQRLDLRLFPFLAEHRFQSKPVFPAAGYLEMALAAGRSQHGAAGLTIEEVDFESALFLPEDEAVPVETRFLDAARFEIFSRELRGGEWIRHASGRILPLPESEVVSESPASIRVRLPDSVDATTFYETFAASGLDYGPAFRGLRNGRRADGEALGEIRLPEELFSEEFHLHPALLDACFQVTMAALPASWRSRGACLPVGVDALRFHRRPGGTVWSHVRLREVSDRALAADVRILDEAGTLLVEVRGFRCRVVDGESTVHEPLDDLLYVSAWPEQPLGAGAPVTRAETWLILADAGGCAEALREPIARLGHRALLVASDPDLRVMLENARQAGGPPVTRILDLRALDGMAPASTTLASLARDEVSGSIALLALVQALDEWPEGEPPRLWLVTRHVHAVEGDEFGPVAIGQAPLWGFRRVMAFEQPRLRPAIVDLGSEPEEWEALVREIQADGSEDEVVLRGDRRYVHRYERTRLAQWTPERIERRTPSTTDFHVHSARLGALDRLRLVAAEAGPLQPHEVRIEIKAAALNFSDVLKALGLYPGTTVSSLSLGAEGAGVITEVGNKVGAECQVGDRVMTIAPHCLGSFVSAPGLYAVPMPPTLTFEQAAGLPIVFMTALYALEDIGRLQPGERVLIHAASGGVGLAAIQVARGIGAEIFATAGTPEKRDFLRSLGVRHVMDSRTLAFADEVLALTNGEGVDLVLNSLAGEAIAKGLAVLRPFGRFVEIGKRDIYANATLGLRPMRNNLTLAAVDLDQAIRTRPELGARIFRAVAAGLASGRFQPLPAKVFPLTEVVEAFRHLSKARHIGKVVVSNEVPEVEVFFPHRERSIRADATYLIVGGVNGFALNMAHWLAKRGARHLVIVSRRGPSANGVPEAIEALAASGATAHVWAADVAEEASLRAVLDRIAAELPPLRGVIHAAMVIDAGVIAHLDAARWKAVTKPKIAGSWNLHAQTLELPLDFFVLTSSIASIHGSPGQANYAAANAFLDALAHYRHRIGRPALTLNLGSLGGAGHVARDEKLSAYLAQTGFAEMPPDEVLEALGRLLGSRASQIGVVRIDLRRMANVLKHRMPPRFATLIESEGSVPEGKSGERALFRTLREAAPDVGEELLLHALAREMSRVLGVAEDRLDVGQPLMALGIDSLMTVELIHWVEDALGANLPAVEIMQNPTTAELARLLWRNLSNGREAAPPSSRRDLRKDAPLDPEVSFAAGRVGPLHPRQPFLTGATGFLGAFLLHELLRDESVVVHCLVRAEGPEAGARRLQENLAAYQLEVSDFERRVIPVVGDLARPQFGLTPGRFSILAEGVDGIFHSGAVVDFLRPFDVLRAANVGGTREILRLAATGRAKRLQYVSSIAVLSATHHSGVIDEGVVPGDTSDFPDGYSESKWAAEMLVREAMRRGLTANIFRPGVISGHTETGEPNMNDASLLLFAASCQAGALPDFEWPIDVVPVDVAARTICHIAAREQPDASTFHIANPRPTASDEFARWLRARALLLERLPYRLWLARMRELTPQLTVEPLLAMLPADEDLARRRLGAVDRRFDITNTRRALAGSGIKLSELTEEQFDVYLRHLAGKALFRTRAPLSST